MADARTVAGALMAAARRLSIGSDTARIDAELLMAHALGASRGDVLLRHMGAAVPPGFAALIERRIAHEPVAYILGRQEFWGLDLAVSPAVLIPRGDSETLITAAQAAFAAAPPARIIDLGTGSGALLLAALQVWPAARGIGIDRSAAALDVATANAGALGFGTRAQMIRGDWHCAGWAQDLGRFDLVLANPPYVESGAVLDASVVDHEPHEALFAGTEGLDDYCVLIPQLAGLLCPGGVAMLEIGWTQADAVTALAQQAGLDVAIHDDLAGRARALEIRAAAAQILQG